MLFFGLRSAPKIFTAIVDALKWVTRHRVIQYATLIMCGAPASRDCAQALNIALITCHQLGVPIAAHKGPATGISVVGIQVNTVAQTPNLPEDRLQRLWQLFSA